MNHRDVRDRLGDYLEGALALPDRALVDAHLDECEGCLHELAELRTTVRMLRALSAVDQPVDVTAAVMRRILEGEAQPSFWERFVDLIDVWARPRALVAVAVGATALAGVLIFEPDLLRERRPAQPEGASIATGPAALPLPATPRLVGAGRSASGPPLELVGHTVRVLQPPQLEGLPPDVEWRLLRGDPILHARSLRELRARGLVQPRVYSAADLYGELMQRQRPLPEADLGPRMPASIPLQSTPVSYPAGQ